MIETIAPPEDAAEEDLAVARGLLEKHSAEDIAAALVRLHRARLPEPEELFDGGREGPREQAGERNEGPRPGFEDTIWFCAGIGRANRADPRWLLPLLCRRGHITKREVGAIRILDKETYFEVPRAAAGRFVDALKRTAGEGDDFPIVPVKGPPGAQSRSGPPPQRRGPKRHAPGPR